MQEIDNENQNRVEGDAGSCSLPSFDKESFASYEDAVKSIRDYATTNFFDVKCDRLNNSFTNKAKRYLLNHFKYLSLHDLNVPSDNNNNTNLTQELNDKFSEIIMRSEFSILHSSKGMSFRPFRFI